MKKKLIICFVLLFCIVISSVGCSEQYKFWKHPLSLEDSSRVWIDDEHDIWFVIEDGYGYGQISSNDGFFNFGIAARSRDHGAMYFLIRRKDGKEIIVRTRGRYDSHNILLTVEHGEFYQLVEGTELIFKPYPRQAEHYLP